jgi:dTDP-4-amino-4,6-dideoxygalactose transaminase
MIPFNRPLVTGLEGRSIERAIRGGRFAGNGTIARRCGDILKRKIGCLEAIMTPSCSAALEMAALLGNLKQGDEVIMPSYAFVTTAGAFALRGAKIVWCEIRNDTKNIDEAKIGPLITPRTRAVVVVHYGGVACRMDVIRKLCSERGLLLVEDAAQAIDACHDGVPLGRFGDLATLSFHETKNVQCGEGGALLINRPDLVERSQVVRDKGTDRMRFERGEVDKYTWIELGSSFLMSELQAAFLYPQLARSLRIKKKRMEIWRRYYRELSAFLPAERLPVIPPRAEPNGHLFYILMENRDQRRDLIAHLRRRGIMAVFHYVPLHRAPFWKGRYDHLSLPVTERVSETLLRLPLYAAMTRNDVGSVVEGVRRYFMPGGRRP